MLWNLCAYCGQRPALIQRPALKSGACADCGSRVGSIIFGRKRGSDGLVIPQSSFRYGEPVMADVYLSETPRVENLDLIGRHSAPLPGRSGGLRIEDHVRIEPPSRRLMKRYYAASTPNAFFRGRTQFVGGSEYDVLAQHGPGRITISYRRSLVMRTLAEGSFDLLN